MILEVVHSQSLDYSCHNVRGEISLMELDIANETWGFMSPVSGRTCSRLEVENEDVAPKDDDDDGDDIDDDDDVHSQCSNNSLVSSTSRKSKKRVQFQADDNLELVYEIPPRGHYSSGEESDSDDSTDDENDDQSSSDSSSESGEIPHHSPSSTKSRGVPQKSSTSLDLGLSHSSSFYNNNISPARGSYSVYKSKDRGSSVVAKITGVTPFHSNVSVGDKSRRKDRSVKRTNASSSCNGGDEDKPKVATRSRAKSTRKRASVKKVDLGKNSVILKRPKESSKTLINLSPRRCSSASRILNGRRSSVSRSPSPTKGLPSARPRSEMSLYPTRKIPNPITRLYDHKDVRVGDSLKNLTLGKVYTIDGFIFPQDPVDQISKAPTVECTPTHATDVPSQSSVQRKRCLSWKMANATSQSPMLHTPCILPLWESIQSVSLTSKPSVKTKY